jgi:methylmalonyl-CoA mutase N-terminal domain/subunit
VRGIDQGWFQRQIAQSAARQQREVEQGRRTIVGVNEFVVDEPEIGIPLLRVGQEAEREQCRRLAELRQRRDDALVRLRLQALAQVAREGRNVIPPMLDCARAYCTLFEIRETLENVYGAYREPVFF